MSRMRSTVPLALLGVAAIALAGCSSSTSPAATAEPAAGALEPATITLYTSEPQEKADELVAAFNEIHPEITVEVFRAGTGDLTTRVATERESGGIQADVFLAADAGTFEGYAAEGLLLEYTPADVEALNADVVDAEGFYTGTRIIPTVIAYNTGIITEAPESWQELTDAAYADQIVMPNPDVSGAAAYNAAVWLDDEQLGEEWMTALAENRPVIADSNGPVSQAVATGAQPVGIVVDYLVRELAEQGSPIAVSYPSEGVPYVSQPVGIFADTEQAEAAQAFVDFLVSEEGQKLAVEQSYLPVRSDVGTPEGAPSMDEITILSPDLETIRSTQDAAVETFRSLFLR
ncbi:ABC transporter substrate-binding protein [Microbacterium imperiale]|uniref:ABC transporter periplasmic component n=1 Tax=Microbacterium imperiale TaxID=33884 RepID=A0A9W6HH57_9MICO|nr:ABC transporter substrate-binding protein [Microbacterium imperiale]MBP2421233.1 iron(III) transport system substrate-binding protein [Microbacterium imperiale]MDS0199656.1 ABC transporter substrate-binding protein [Microbacterium imperiale]BFE41573.1 ABC transporter substrate-binding protein [Microbacterium imperiale]GLJ80524.1 ABC transporter periplasmic component [Microbacterium imperiale]